MDEQNPDGITAYHGSPHEFDKFDLSEINEKSSHGQNFGHGLYFAENEPTAFEYKKPSFALDSDPQGHMYEVHIDAHPDHFLDWDKPLSEQSYILKAIDQHIGDPQSVIERLSPTGSSNITGRELYEAMGGQHKASAVSQRLHEMGIHGIKYVDYKARGNWNPETGNYENSKHNYVVFDHDRVNIKRRYAEGGEVEREGFGFGGDTEFAGSAPERGATGSAVSAPSEPSQHETLNAYAGRGGEDTEGNRGNRSGGSDAMGFKNLDFSKGAAESAREKLEAVFPTKISGFAGAPAIGMPQSLKELQSYNPSQEDAGIVAPGLKTYSFFNPDFAPKADLSSLTANKNPITGTGENAGLTGTPQDRPFMTAKQALEREAQKGFGAQPTDGIFAEYSQDPSKTVAANIASPPPAISSSSAEYNVKFDPVLQSFVRTTDPQIIPNVAMGMSGRISPASTTQIAAASPLAHPISSIPAPDKTPQHFESSAQSNQIAYANVPQHFESIVASNQIPAAKVPQHFESSLAANQIEYQPVNVASSSPATNQQDALVLPGQKLFTRQSGPPMPPIPDRDLGAGNLLDTVLKPFGLDTASWLDNKSSEYIKQGMLPSDAYTKASYDLRDLQMSNKQNSGQGGKGRRLVKKLMPDGTYQDVWEDYKRGGVAKKRPLPHNSTIVEHALAKISAPPPALNPTLKVAKRGRPF